MILNEIEEFYDKYLSRKFIRLNLENNDANKCCFD